LSQDKKSIDAMTEAAAAGLAAGMRNEDMEAVAARIQARNRQQTANKAEIDQLAVQTMQTMRTMARLGVPSADVAETLCQALQNQYTHREMKQLRQQIAVGTNQASPLQIANRHAGSIGKGGAGSGSGTGGAESGSGGSSGSGNGAGGSGSGSGSGGSGGGSGNGSGGTK
jgi:hypothetical protein